MGDLDILGSLRELDCVFSYWVSTTEYETLCQAWVDLLFYSVGSLLPSRLYSSFLSQSLTLLFCFVS